MARAVRFHLAFSVVVLALLSPGAAAALPAGQPLAAPLDDFASRLTGWFTSWWGEVGCSLDPSGACGENLDVGCSLDPNGRCRDGLEVGCSADPNGGCGERLDVGCSWDPNGGCGERLDIGCSMDPSGGACASRD